MKTVSAHQANREFLQLLSRVQRGEEILQPFGAARLRPEKSFAWAPPLWNCKTALAFERAGFSE